MNLFGPSPTIIQDTRAGICAEGHIFDAIGWNHKCPCGNEGALLAPMLARKAERKLKLVKRVVNYKKGAFLAD